MRPGLFIQRNPMIFASDAFWARMGCYSESACLQQSQDLVVVAQRLGHSNLAMTLNVYAHATPDMQQDATRLAALLQG
jgi:integrase